MGLFNWGKKQEDQRPKVTVEWRHIATEVLVKLPKESVPADAEVRKVYVEQITEELERIGSRLLQTGDPRDPMFVKKVVEQAKREYLAKRGL